MLISQRFTRKVFLSFILILFSITSSACKNSTDPENLNTKVVPVTVMRVTKGTIENATQYPGIIQPKKIAYVASAISGKVDEVYFDVGDRIKKGELLFTIDSTEFEDSIKVLEEQLKVVEANLSMAQTGVIAASGSQYESQKLQLETALKSAEHNFTLAKDAFDKATLLKEIGLLDSTEYSKIKNQFYQAQNALEAADSAYELYLTKISKDAIAVADDQLKQAQTSYDMLNLQIENARKKLSYTKVTSPMDGIIATKEIVSGCLISNTMIPYTIIDSDAVQVVIAVTEQVITKVEKNDELEVLIPAVASVPFKGIVDTVSPAVGQKTMTYSILIDIPNKKGAIKPGMTAKVDIITERHDESILIPASSIIKNENGSFVYTVESGHAMMKPVNTGIRNQTMVEISSGLKAGELLVVRGQQFLNHNDQVNVSEEVSE